MNNAVDSLQNKIALISKEKRIDASLLYVQLFFEAFLLRLSLSSYAHAYSVKGGVLLSSYFGLARRSTLDLDFSVFYKELSRDWAEESVKEILAVPYADGIHFELRDISPLHTQGKAGFRLRMTGRLGHVRTIFSVDLSSDEEMEFGSETKEYSCLFHSERLFLSCSTWEKIIADKLAAALIHGEENSRCKDYYDLYLLQTLKEKEVSSKSLATCFSQVCLRNGILLSYEHAHRTFREISESPKQKEFWERYVRKHTYAKDLPFALVASSLSFWLERMAPYFPSMQ